MLLCFFLVASDDSDVAPAKTFDKPMKAANFVSKQEIW